MEMDFNPDHPIVQKLKDGAQEGKTAVELMKIIFYFHQAFDISIAELKYMVTWEELGLGNTSSETINKYFKDKLIPLKLKRKIVYGKCPSDI